MSAGPFEAGDLVLLVDKQGRRALVTLEPGGRYHSHNGPLAHDDLISQPEGCVVSTTMGRRYRAFRPTYADYVLKMPRGAQVIYPKDVGQILVWADIHPGASVLEAGTGSGALTIALLRAVGPKGTVHTVERREDFRSKALRNIERFAGADPAYGTLDSRIADVYTDELDVACDRVVLDVTEPWLALGNVERCLRPGGVLCSYMPTITQVQRLAEAVKPPRWGGVHIFETLHRTWNVEGLSVRPDHRMVAHTAWLFVSRRLAPEDA